MDYDYVRVPIVWHVSVGDGLFCAMKSAPSVPDLFGFVKRIVQACVFLECLGFNPS